jgi:phosphonate transport system permease protein
MSTDAMIRTKGIAFDSAAFGYLLLLSVLFIARPQEEQLLNMGANAAIVAVALVAGALIAMALGKTKVSTLGATMFAPQHLKAATSPLPWFRTFWGWQTAVALCATLAVGVAVTDFSIRELTDEEGFLGAKRIFSALLSPEPAILPTGIIAIIETIYIAFMATAVAVPVAFVLAFFAAKNIMNTTTLGQITYFTLRAVLNIVRSIEPLIWAIVFSVWVGIGPFAGMLALLFHSVASLTKQYSEIIEGADEGPIEGIKATGGNPIQVVWYAIVPQVILPYIAFTIYRWDINVRMATIIGLVGGGGIGTLLIQYQGQARWHEVGTLALLIVAIVWTMDTLSAQIREALK